MLAILTHIYVQSSAALRVARGTGLERPDPGGEKSCRLAEGSADMLCLASDEVSVYRWQRSGHSVHNKSRCHCRCLRVGLADMVETRLLRLINGPSALHRHHMPVTRRL